MMKVILTTHDDHQEKVAEYDDKMMGCSDEPVMKSEA